MTVLLPKKSIDSSLLARAHLSLHIFHISYCSWALRPLCIWIAFTKLGYSDWPCDIIKLLRI